MPAGYSTKLLFSICKHYFLFKKWAALKHSLLNYVSLNLTKFINANMADRSANMRAIKSRNTKPELALRALLRQLGYPGYRLHRKDLPGKPDVVYVGRKKAIFVHGCFWHGHPCKNGYHLPRTNPGYWGPKIARNMERDREHISKLKELGWSVLVIWECAIEQPDIWVAIRNFLEN